MPERARTTRVTRDNTPDRARIACCEIEARILVGGPGGACSAASVTPAPTVTCPSARSTSSISVRRVSERTTS